jgi:hypothetical protein
MEWQDGVNYRAPDGRVFTAKMEKREHAALPGWTFVPPSLKSNWSWRDSLEQLLFSEDDKIVYFDFSGTVPTCVDTGWKPDDFRLEASDREGLSRVV